MQLKGSPQSALGGHKDTNVHKEKYLPLSEREEKIGRTVVNAAYAVHSALGPGLLEKVYEICFCHELAKRHLAFKRQVDIPIIYDGLCFDEGLRLDVLVEDVVICELKSVDFVFPVWEAQLLTQLKLTRKRLGFLINFNVPLVKNGIRRRVL